MMVRMTDKELTAIMAAGYVLARSKEVKYGAEYISNRKDIKNCSKISFEDAVDVLYDFVEKVSKEWMQE